MSEEELQQRLCSESVLLIRREDVLQRFTPDCCLSGLSHHPSDQRWRHLDVEGEAAAPPSAVANSPPLKLPLPSSGQVRKMIQEEEEPKQSHIRIPAAYSSGVTLFVLHESQLSQELLAAAELPLL